jgi:hypothetical protein
MKFRTNKTEKFRDCTLYICREDSNSWFGDCPVTNRRLFDISGIQVEEITDEGIKVWGLLASHEEDNTYHFSDLELKFDKADKGSKFNSWFYSK